MSKKLSYELITQDRCPACQSQDGQHFFGRRLNQRGGLFPWRIAGVDLPVFRCHICQLVYSNPLPVPISISQHYGTNPEEYWNESYFQVDSNKFGEEAEKIESLIPESKQLKFLDIGAGIGKTMRSMMNRGWNVWGIEPGERFYKAAIEKGGIAEDRLMKSSIEDAHFENNFFDVISFAAVIEHLPDPFSCLDKSIDWLRPGGIIHIEVPSSNWLISKAYRLLQKCMGSQYVTNLSPMHVPYHLYEFSHKSFQLLPFANRFSIADHQYFPCLTYLPKGLGWLATKTMTMTNTGMQIVIYLRKN